MFVPARCFSTASRCGASSTSDLPRRLIWILPHFDDVRAERAAMALSVGLSWPPVKRRRSARRHSWWQHWERALQDTLHHHELPHGVRLQRPGWWQTRRRHRPTACTRGDRQRQHSSPPRPPQPLQSSKRSLAAAVRSAARSSSTPTRIGSSSSCVGC